MNCDLVKSLIPEYLAASPARGEMLQIQAHISHCKVCFDELESMEETWQTLGEWPEEIPGERMSRNFYHMLEGFQDGLTAPDPSTKIAAGPARWFHQPGVQILAAVALLLIGILVGTRSAASPDNTQQLRQDLDQMTTLVGMSLMEKETAAERINGVRYVSRLDQPNDKVLDTLLHMLAYDESVNVRLSAVEALYFMRDRPEVRSGLVLSLPKQESALVQAALIDCLVVIDTPDAVTGLKALIKNRDTDPLVKEKAELGLMEIQ